MIIKFVKQNITLFSTFTIIGILAFYAYGCQPHTNSLMPDNGKVDRSQLICEMDILLAKYESGIKDLDTQEKIRSIIFQQGLIVAQGGTFDPSGLLITLLGVFGVGVTVDDLKSRRKLKNVVSEIKAGAQN